MTNPRPTPVQPPRTLSESHAPLESTCKPLWVLGPERRYRVTRNPKGPEQPSVDNRPAHRLGPVDGLRSGGSPPRQASSLRLFFEPEPRRCKRQGLALGKAAPSCFRRLARP